MADATQLSNDAGALLANLPPGPSAPDISAAMVFCQQAAKDLTTSVSDVVTCDIATATTLMEDASTAQQQATAKIEVGTAIINGG